jgi:hypothetical protein
MGQTMNDLLAAILKLNGIDPDAVGGSGQTALQRLEGAVNGALDDLDETDDEQAADEPACPSCGTALIDATTPYGPTGKQECPGCGFPFSRRFRERQNGGEAEGPGPAAREGSSRVAKAPPGWGEKAMRRLKEQYPGHPEKAFATAWSLHKRNVSGEDYLSGKSSSRSAAPASYMRMLDEVVGAVCEPIIREAKRKQLKKKTRGHCVFPAESSSVTDDKDHFPINSLAQARNALARVMQYDACPGWYAGSLKGLQGAVRREVYGQFPGLKKRKEEREGK